MSVYELPSFIALIFKLGLLGYAAKSPVRNHLTRTFLVLLLVLSLVNLVEFSGLAYIHNQGFERVTASGFGFAYFALFIPAIALLLHLSLLLGLDRLAGNKQARWVLGLLYLPVVALELALLFTDHLVAGFQQFEFSVLRAPGVHYYLFEAYAVIYVAAAAFCLIYGARRSSAPQARMRNRLWLLALSPMLCLVMYRIIANHFDLTRLTSTFYVPIAVTFFLVVTTYTMRQHRLVDIEFYIPWSRGRRHKTAFYARIHTLVSDIGELGSIEAAVKRMSDTLGCPVALIGDKRPAIAHTSGARFDWRLAPADLRGLDRIVVRNEIAETRPELFALLQQHGIAAVVPFYPHAHNASGWLLLGEGFNDNVYSARDFRQIDALFDRMADLFLDRLVGARSQLHELAMQTRALEQKNDDLQKELAVLRGENQALSAANMQLAHYQPVDSIESAVAQAVTGAVLCFVGRDIGLAKQLQQFFPQLAHYRSLSAAGFRRQPAPDVLLVALESSQGKEVRALETWLRETPKTSAVMLCGAGAMDFADKFKTELRSRLCDIMPAHAGASAYERRVIALAELHRVTVAIPNADTPLLGRSKVFRDHIQQVRQFAALAEPLVLRHEDPELARALAMHIHDLSGRGGRFAELRLRDMPDDDEGAEALVDSVLEALQRGTLLVEGMPSMSAPIRARLLDVTRVTGEVRVIASCDLTVNCDCEPLLLPFRPLALRIPPLRSRVDDLRLLVHYYTLQFNLQSGESRYLRETELNELRAADPENLTALRQQVFTLLGGPAIPASHEADGELTVLPDATGERTLDQHVAEFEERMIADALARCGGNKAKAARLLGVRANTLHYKLERYQLKEVS